MGFSKKNCAQSLFHLPQQSQCSDLTSKADLATIIQAGAQETGLSPSLVRTCTDGMALVRAIGKPQNASTFGDYADIFIQKVTGNLHMGTLLEWI